MESVFFFVKYGKALFCFLLPDFGGVRKDFDQPVIAVDIIPQWPEMVVRRIFPIREPIPSIRTGSAENVTNPMFFQALNYFCYLPLCGVTIARNFRKKCWVVEIQVEVNV